MVHECLERWRSIAETEKHDCGFIETEGSNEYGLPLIFFSNVNIVISCYNLLFPSPLSHPPSLTQALSPRYLVTLSPTHPATLSPCHPITSSPVSPLYYDTLRHPIVLVLILSMTSTSSSTSTSSLTSTSSSTSTLSSPSSHSHPCLVFRLCISPSIPFLRHCILPSLVPVL